MPLEPPPVDERRAGSLREAILAAAADMVPEWGGAGEEGGFGHALAEIAARLAEHTTRRLDQTPLRDQLALYDALDIARAPQRSAEAPLVFTLSEKREADVFAPALTEVTAAGPEEDIFFETTEAAELTPARLAALITTDPAADRIECAPAAFLGDPEVARSPAEYRLAAAAAPGGTLVQLDRITDLAAGDLLRIGGGAYRIAGFDGNRVLLAEPLETLVPADATIARIDALEAFALRDLQQHALYLGHPELLLLEGKARIFVQMKPAGVVKRLMGLDPAIEVWGIDKDKGQDEPDWLELDVAATANGTLTLDKAWQGPTEELEIDGRKARWLRLRLKTPLDPATAPDTTIDEIELRVTTPAPTVGPEGEGPRSGTRTLEASLYNSLPLPLTGAFLPLGQEPQRFDTFAIAAPEALSKKGARVALDIQLSDASPLVLSAVAGAGEVVYGIGLNGMLQLMRVTRDGGVDWRQLPPPEAEDERGEVRLNPQLGLSVVELLPGATGNQDGARHLVLAGDTAGRLHLGTLDLGASDTVDWKLLSPPPETVRAALLVPAPLPLRFRIIAVGANAIHVRNVGFTGVPSSLWIDPVGNSPPPAGESVQLLPGGPGLGVEQLFALVSGDGTLFTASCGLAGNVTLTDLSAAGVPKVTASAAAFVRNNVCIVAGYEPATGLFLAGTAGVIASEPVPPVIGALHRVMIDPAFADTAAPQPVVVATGEGGAALWTHPGRIARLPWPPDIAGAGQPAAALSVGSAGRAVLLVDAGDERVLALPAERSETQLTAQRFHAVAIAGPVPAADFLRLETPSGPDLRPMPNEIVRFDAVRRIPVPLSVPLQDGDAFQLLRSVQAGLAGVIHDQSAGEFDLEPGETDTVFGAWLKIGGAVYRVTAIAEPNPGERRVTLSPAPPGADGDALAYDVLDQQASGTIAASDIGTLARIDDEPPERLAHLTFDAVPDNEVPAVQPTAQPATQHWLRLSSVPAGAPPSGEVTLFGAFELRRYRASALPRSSDNPELSWEYFNGAGWRRLAVRDGTRNLARSEKVVFTVPLDLTPTELAGQQNHWIRARLVGGDYGQARYILDTSVPDKQAVTVERSHLNPPEIVAIDAIVVDMPATPAEAVLTDNCLQRVDQSQAARTPGASFPAFEGIDAHVGSAVPTERSLYLCFTRALTANQLTLFAAAAEGEGGRAMTAEVLGELGWRGIDLIDRSEGLTRPGIVKLFLSAPPVGRTLFGHPGWWLRLAVTEPVDWTARLSMLLPNAVLARQTRAFRQEILGSSLGEPGQSFTLLEPPVLPGSIDLRVREVLSAEEAAALRAEAGDAGEVATYPNVTGEWVRWHQVDSFAGASGADRVFRLNPASGEVRFGDARRGRIPPAGRDSVRAAFYQSGGGSIGNVPAFAVRNLKSALPAIDKVVNLMAGGGADTAAPESLARTAPVRLRHGGEALAPADVEAIVTDADPEIVQARCLASPGGAIELVVAVRLPGLARAPLSFAKREGIAALVAERGWGALSPRQIAVRGPDFVPLRVRVHVVAAAEEEVAALASGLRTRLELLFDPVRGGPEGAGWPFGARPWTSHVQRAIDEFAAVAMTLAVEVEPIGLDHTLDALPQTALVCADPDAIILRVDPPESAP